MDKQESEEYFKTYGDLGVHRAMLMDVARIDGYWNAVFASKDRFNGKVVLDLGAGTGILSVFCANAGARKVYAVEASEKMIPLLKNVVNDNELNDVIEVIYGEVETVNLPEKVDILISEWMGHFLLHEGMLNSVISARRLLQSDGIIIPQKSTIYVALCDMPCLARDWSQVKGVNLCSVTTEYRSEAAKFPCIEQIKAENFMSESKIFATFDSYSVSLEDTENHNMKSVFVANKDGIVEGICIWWDVILIDDIVLSTSPSSLETHWKQTIILFPTPVEARKGTPICIDLTISKSTERHYTISLTMLDADDEEHDLPCDCYYDTCRVAKAFLLDSSNS